MECPNGCVLESDCSENTTFIIFTICIGFTGVFGGLICHIFSLNKKIEDNSNSTSDREAPPLYSDSL
jgi:hypothetical protein